MKNIFKYMLLLGAVAFGLASCQEEEADIKGLVGEFVYIVDGAEAEYAGPTCEIYHTPIGELGEIRTDVVVALTKVQKTDVNVVLALDNTSLSDGYTAFPEGVVEFEENVTIPAGEKEVTVEMTVANADFPKLTEEKYQAVLRIASANAVKISTNSNAACMMAVTETIDPADNVVSVNASTSTYELKHYNDGSVTANITKNITITGTEPAFLAFDVTLGVDNTLIAAYNEANGTSYQALPSDVTVTFPEKITMDQDATSVRASVSISEEDQLKLTSPNGYLVPVVVTDAGDATVAENTGVVYLVINVKVFDSSKNFFYSLYPNDYRLANWNVFDNGIDLSSGFTIVVHALIEETSFCLARFADANEAWNVRMQFNQERGATALKVMIGANRKYLWAPAIEYNTWVQYAVTWDPQATEGHFKLYLEKELVDQITLTEAELAKELANPFTFKMLEFGSSWTYEPQGNEFRGRVMHFGIFNWALNDSWLGYCYRTDWNRYVVSDSRYGLCAYWPMNEGYGYVCEEATGRYEDIDFKNKAYRIINDGEPRTKIDVSDYVKWIADDKNNFDE